MSGHTSTYGNLEAVSTIQRPIRTPHETTLQY